MTAIQAAVVDRAGNINIHGRSGLVIVWKVMNAEGSYIDISASDLFLEIDTKIRIELTAGDDVYSRKASLTRTQIATLPLNKPLAYALHDETPSSPCTIWSGLITSYGFKTAPSGAAAVDPGTASWSGATVTVQQGESVPTVVVTYMGATGATGAGVPTGGVAGQALLKVDGTDYNSVWTSLAISHISNLQAALDAKASLAGATMAGVLAFVAGTVSAPGLAVAGDLNTGIYQPIAGALAVTAGGQQVQSWGVGTSTLTGNLLAGADATHDQGALGANRWRDYYASRSFIGPLGAVGAPSHTFAGDSDTGLWSPAANTWALSAGGVETIRGVSGAVSVTGTLAATSQFLAANGSAAAPAYSWTGDPNTGIYNVSADVLGVAAGGTARITVSASGLMPFADATYDLGAASTRFYAGLFSNSVKIGGAAPAGSASLSSIQSFGSNWSLIGGDVLTDAATKRTRHGYLHYLAAEEPVTVYLGYADATQSIVSFGGGTSSGNAATRLEFWTAANNSTVTGTQRWFIDSAGFFYAAADNTYDFGAASSARARSIYAGTNVVIGYSTTSAAQLHVGAGGVLQLPNGVGTNTLPQVINSQTSGVAVSAVGIFDGARYRRAALFVDDTNGFWGLSGAASSGVIPFIIWNNGAEQLRLTTAGYLGIGGVNPATSLHVRTPTTIYEAARFDATDTSVYTSWAIANTRFAFVGSASQITDGGTATALAIRSDNILYFASGGSTRRWLIDASGHFLPSADVTYDKGAIGSRIRGIYGRQLDLSYSADGAQAIVVVNSSAGVSARTGMQLTNDGGSLAFVALHGSGTAAGIGRPNMMVIQGPYSAGVGIHAAHASGVIDFITGGSSSGNTRWQITAAGVFKPNADVTYDVATAAAQVRDAYIGRYLKVAGAIDIKEAAAPPAIADTVRLYAEDNGAGKTRLMALFPTGAAQQIAIEA